jgi:MFS family permease
MEKVASTQRLGPILLAPGIRRSHVVTKIYAAFITVAMLTGMSFLQAYLLTEHLHIPRGEQGTIAGDLTFWAEIVSLCFFSPFGILADRIGRRPVYVGGILLIGLGYGLYPFATSFTELLIYRLISAVGVAAAAGMIATLTNDYPQEKSRGLLIGITSMTNILGVIFMAAVVAQIPSLLIDRGFDPVTSGKVMFMFAASLCIVTAAVARLGLKGGTAVARHERAGVNVLVTSGLRAAMNPRIALSYAGAFAARSDLVIQGLFLALWAIHDGAQRDMSPAEAMARFGGMIIIMQGVSLAAAPVFGWFMDQVNRVTATIVALIFATLGYLSMGIITSPLDFAMAPYFIVLAFGSSFMLKSSLGLVGQEAPPKERASIIAALGMFGALGILILTLFGGRLFDTWGPWAPFVVAGAYQGILLILAIVIRIVAPGPDLVGRRRWFPSPAALGTAAANSGKTGQRTTD